LWNWVHVFTTESKIDWVFAVLKWVFMKIILGKTTFPLHFLCNIIYFNWVFINSFAYWYPLIEKQLGIPEKYLGKYPKSILSISPLEFYNFAVNWPIFAKISCQ